ncbi:MAG TPA: DUF819 family protein [Longimicrobiales bacterium]|nr:DUF819 family protein [Longimicrobiales bacterium]
MEPQVQQALLTDPMAVFAYLATLLAVVFWLSGQARLGRLFAVIPPVLFAYFLPTISTALYITPVASPAYDWMVRFLLPVALLLLMITVDLPSILRLGPMALAMMLAGTIGIIIGGAVSFAVFGRFLPEDAWTGFAALSGSWIGGTANMIAIAESVGTPDSILGPVIVVDTVVGYGWMGVLLFLSAWQTWYDRKTRARTEMVEATNRRLAELTSRRHPTDLRDVAMILGLGFGGAVVAREIGARLPTLGDPTIISHTTWAVLIVVTAGLLLSFTRVRNLEEVGASRFGFLALYLMITAIGAQADLRAVLQTPLFFAAGLLWIAIHVVILFGAARLLRAPLFFVATGSMANIGGPATAPLVASVYHPAMAPVGLLMAVAGYILGIYAGLVSAWILGGLAG